MRRSGGGAIGRIWAPLALLLLPIHPGIRAQDEHRQSTGRGPHTPVGALEQDERSQADSLDRSPGGGSLWRCAAGAQFGPAEAIALLRRGYRAERVAVYSGVKVISAPDRCRDSPTGRTASRDAGRDRDHVCSDYERSVRMWHGGPALTRLEFVDQVGKTAPVVVENGRNRWYYSPRHQTWRPISWSPPEPRLDLLLKNYRASPGGLDRVAGRLALKVRIEPRHPGNPRKHSWLDLATGIALRSDLYDHRGHLVSTARFRYFRTETCLPPTLFQAPGAAACAPDEAAPQARLSFAALLPRHLPPGYVLDRISRSRQGETEVVRARYTDGLNILSLVQWKGPRDPGDKSSERFWAPGERVRRTIGPLTTLLAGDLSGDELRRVCASIRPSPRGAAAQLAHK
jgi:hypothetical protein